MRPQDKSNLVCLCAQHSRQKRCVARGGPLKYRPYTAVVVRLSLLPVPNVGLDADRRARRDNRRGADSNAATLRARTRQSGAWTAARTRHQRETTTTWPRKPPPASSSSASAASSRRRARTARGARSTSRRTSRNSTTSTPAPIRPPRRRARPWICWRASRRSSGGARSWYCGSTPSGGTSCAPSRTRASRTALSRRWTTGSYH